MKKFLLATVAALALATGSALAADLPVKKAPVIYKAPVQSWTGLYVGVVGGYLKGSQTIANSNDDPVIDQKGGSLGVLIGAQQQFGHYVLGLEADLSKSWAKGDWSTSTSLADIWGTYTYDQRDRSTVDWYATARIRAGYLLSPDLLVYGTGGAIFGKFGHEATITQSYTTPWWSAGSVANSVDKLAGVGAIYGVGLEWRFAPNFTLKGEWLKAPYISNLSGTYSDSFGQSAWNKQFHKLDMARVAVTYQFGAPPPAVVAKY